MSDISFNFSWAELLLIFGWPGLLLGAAAGGVFWRGRRLVGGAVGAVVGLAVWACAAFALKMI